MNVGLLLDRDRLAGAVVGVEEVGPVLGAGDVDVRRVRELRDRREVDRQAGRAGGGDAFDGVEDGVVERGDDRVGQVGDLGRTLADRRDEQAEVAEVLVLGLVGALAEPEGGGLGLADDGGDVTGLRRPSCRRTSSTASSTASILVRSTIDRVIWSWVPDSTAWPSKPSMIAEPSSSAVASGSSASTCRER